MLKAGRARLAGIGQELREGFQIRRMQKDLSPEGRLGLLGYQDTYTSPGLTISNKIGYAASQPAVQLAGLGLGGMALSNAFFGNEQQAQAPQQSITMPMQSSAAQVQAANQMSVPMLNEEQISKARKRAEEQAALNAFYAQSLNNYGQGGQY